MATTKIHEIRSTLGKAIKYICNNEKTKDMTLVYSNGIPFCDSINDFSNTAETVMNMTAEKGSSRARNGNRLAYHLIQSFSPEDDITPEIAFEIGKKYAERITDNKYEYVVATHADREHIHTHIIFNATSYVTRKKYHHSAKDIKRIQDISDRLCREYKMSIINEKTGRKGLNHDEYQKAKRGSSWRTKLADLIDEAVCHSSTFDDFIFYLQEEGVTVRQGKDLSYKCELLGQERACRGKSIGSGYTKESIMARIYNDVSYLSAHDLKRFGAYEPDGNGGFAKREYEKTENNKASRKRNTKDEKKDNSFKDKKIGLIKDVNEIEKARASRGYANKVNISNMNNILKSVNYLEEHGFNTSEDLAAHEVELSNRYKLAKIDLERVEKKKAILSQKITMIQNYRKNQRCYIDYLRSKKDPKFKSEHEQEIKDFLLADIYFKQNNMDVKSEDLSKLFEEIKGLNASIKSQKNIFYDLRRELKNVQTVRKNYESILNKELVSEDEEIDLTYKKEEKEKESRYDFLNERKEEISSKYISEKEMYDGLESRRKTISLQISNLQKYIKNQSAYVAYKKSGESDSFYSDNKEAIDEYIEAMNYFKENNIDVDSLKLSELFAELKEIIPLRNEKKDIVKKLKRELDDLSIFGDDMEQDITHEKKTEEEKQDRKKGTSKRKSRDGNR